MITYDDEILAVEMSSYCNLKCPMCTQSRVDYGKKGFMPLDLWKKLVDDMVEQGHKYYKLLPFGLGESLLHPHAFEMLDYLFEKNKKREIFHFINLHTNALLMDQNISNLFIKYIYQIGALHFSLDAASQEVYEKVRPKAKLQTAIDNIVYFIKKRTQIPPKLIFQFIVMEKNYHEASDFLKLWKNVLHDHNLKCQVNYDWFPEMTKDTIFFKRENTWNPRNLGKSEKLHKEVVESLGLIEKGKEGRILQSDEFIKK